jgi:hypothetical protein
MHKWGSYSVVVGFIRIGDHFVIPQNKGLLKPPWITISFIVTGINYSLFCLNRSMKPKIDIM